MDWLWSMEPSSKLPTCSTDKNTVPMVTSGWACMDPTESVRSPQANPRTYISRAYRTAIVIFDPNGKHLKDIEFSGKNLTCPTWGGKNLDILFVTSAKDPILGIKDGDEGGNMFKYMVRAGSNPKGKPKFEFAG
jgi:hypothetical protein